MSEADCEAALPELLRGAEALGIRLTTLQNTQFVRYCHALREASATMNLTAIRSASGIIRTLFLDSLTVVQALPDSLRTRPSVEPRVVDVGAGAGIPGVPLKIAHPHWQLTLVESIGKKARFLETLGQRVGLDGITVVADRAENLGHEPAFRDSFDLCLARAVSSLPSLIELSAPLARTDGFLVFPKGSGARSEVEAARTAARCLRVELLDIIEVSDHLGLGGDRHLVVYRKIERTPPGYPRRVGLAQSRPL